MKTILTYKIYLSVQELPESWNDFSSDNIFLSKEYLTVLEHAAPLNMECHFIGLYQNNKLEGIALAQFLDINKLESFGERDKCIKASIRNFIFKRFGSHVLLVGNNMLTGQNAFSFSKEVNLTETTIVLKKSIEELKSIYNHQKKKIHIISFKDFEENEMQSFDKVRFKSYFKFSTQPNMIFSIDEKWKTEQDYIDSLSKKYRDQYKRARKKCEGVTKRKMSLKDILQYEETIYNLYFYVAKNAPFNTFFLPKNHFSVFKENLKDNFLFYGYFRDEQLLGFNTLIKNGDVMDTYFLGYDSNIQSEKMLYLNMLYDMIGYSINKGFKEIIFARTALEIKSSVGAKPVEMYGLMQHGNKIVNKFLPKIFNYLEPKTEWKARNPFK